MKRLGYVLVTTAALLAAPAVHAQMTTLQAQTPGGHPVVLNVRDGDGLRCLSVKFGDEPARRTSPCAPAPKDAHDDARALRAVYRGAPEKLTILYGTASAGTRELKVRLGDGRLVVIQPDATSGAYLQIVTGRPAVATVNAHDASGALRGAADLDPRAVEPVRGPFALLRTRDERGRRATLSAFAARIYRERSTRRPLQACIGIGRRGASPTSNVEPGHAGGFACTHSRRRILVRFAAGCAHRRLLLYGIAPTVVTRLRLITARGQRFTLRTAAFPRRLRHPGRAFVLSGRDPGPLSRLEAYARNGSRIASLALSGVGSGCGSSSRS